MDPSSISPAASWRPRLGRMLRRSLLALGAVLALAFLVGSFAVLRVDFGAAERAAVERLTRETGLRISFSSREESRFPRPHVTFEGLTISRQSGDLLVEAKTAELKFSLADLFDGSLDAPTLVLRDAAATLDTALIETPLKSPRALTDLVQEISGLFDQQKALDSLNIIIEAGRLTLRHAGQPNEARALGPLAINIHYSARRGRVDARLTQAGSGAPGASVPLNQQMLKLAFSLPTRSALTEGRAIPAWLEASLGDSRLAFGGEAKGVGDLALTGKLEATLGETFEHLLDWKRSGRELREASKLSAGMTLDSRGMGLDSLRIVLGNKALTGIAALREVAGRWSLSATLGGDLVDGTAAHRALQGIRDAKGAWSREPLNLNPLPQLDLDLRLSTKAFRLGRFALSDVALSVLTRANRTEMAIVDSRFGAGSFKARVTVGSAAEGDQQTLRLSTSGENLEGGDLLEQAFAFDRLTGTGSFVVQAQGQGASVAALMGSMQGTAALDLRNGVLNGIDLNRLMTRSGEQRAETALLFSLVGKTPFDSLRTDFTLNKGRLEPVGSRFLTRTVDGVMEGYTDIGAQQHHLSVILRKRGENDVPQGDFFGFRLEGALMSPGIKPDSRLLHDKG